MPKYLVHSGGDPAVKGEIINRNDRRFPMPVQNKFALTLWTDDYEICGRVFRNIKGNCFAEVMPATVGDIILVALRRYYQY